MCKMYCSQCVQQQSWVKLVSVFLRLTVTIQELDALGFCSRPRHEQTALIILNSKTEWLKLSGLIDQKLAIDKKYEEYTLFQLLELWGMLHKNGSKEIFLPVLWSLIGRREDCPYRICRKVLVQLQDMTYHNFVHIREAS